MDVLVLGGTYFIGKVLVELLMPVANSVWILNRGTRSVSGKVGQISANRHNLADMKGALFGKKFDVVFDISGYTENDVAIATEALGRRFGQYVFCSSIAVCKQLPIYWPITEAHQKCDSVQDNKYGYDKLTAEQHLFAYGKENKIPITVVRPVYVYGPNDYSGRLDYFFERISKNAQIVVAGNGENIIQFGYVYDLCNAMISMMGKKIAFGEAFNVSGIELVSVNQLIGLISSIMCTEAKVLYGVSSEDSSPITSSHRFADIGKARDILRIIPETRLFDGLTKTYQWWLTKGGSK